jgi:ribulose-phosphate 3-epimerase
LNRIKARGKKCCAVLNPATPAEALSGAVELADMILLMSVNPGFGGQSFIEPVLEKIEAVRGMITRAGREVLLEVDGGINAKYAPLAVSRGADVLVAGSYIFGAENPARIIEELRGL